MGGNMSKTNGRTEKKSVKNRRKLVATKKLYEKKDEKMQEIYTQKEAINQCIIELETKKKQYTNSTTGKNKKTVRH